MREQPYLLNFYQNDEFEKEQVIIIDSLKSQDVQKEIERLRKDLKINEIW